MDIDTDINTRFLKRNEASNWDIVANHFYGIENITEEQKELVKNAFLFLKMELGENYLREINTNHPMIFHINNYVLTSRLWFVDVATDIQRLKEFPNYKALHRRLARPEKFPEGFSVLEIAIKFCKVGLNIEFDPKVEVNGRPKEPDLKVINSTNGEFFFCEVSVLNASVIEKDASNTEMKLFNAVVSLPNLLFAGKVERILDENGIKNISDQIFELKKRVNEETGFGELIIKDVLTLGLSTEENKDKIVKWADENNCEVGNFEQPYYESNALQRIKTKINTKRKQLPYDRSNLIMIYDNNFFYTCGDTINVISELEKFLEKYKNITGVIIRGKGMTTIEPIIAKIKQHVFIQKYQYDTYAEQYLIIWNMDSERIFNEETKNRIIDSILYY